MKRLSVLITACLMTVGCLYAQNNLKSFQHLSLGANFGTEGYGFQIATPAAQWAELRFGMNFMPSFSVNGEVDVQDINAGGVIIPINAVKVKGSFERTTMHFMADFYPVGNLFLTAGFSFGGNTLIKLNGHSEDLKAYYAANPTADLSLLIDRYNLKVDNNGDFRGGIKVSGFRPYLGIGYGRAVPSKRITFRTEIGLQFHGKPKVYSGSTDNIIDAGSNEGDNDIAKWVDKFSVYPVLRFTLSGRLF